MFSVFCFLSLGALRGAGPADRPAVVLTTACGVEVVGAATDVASALLVEPTWAERVSIVAMGFEGWPAGGDPWNVKNDVKAWQVLLDSRAPIVVGDSTVTKRDLLMTPARARDRFGRF